MTASLRQVSFQASLAMTAATILFGAAVYDGLVRSPLLRGLVAFTITVLIGYTLLCVHLGRESYAEQGGI